MVDDDMILEGASALFPDDICTISLKSTLGLYGFSLSGGRVENENIFPPINDGEELRPLIPTVRKKLPRSCVEFCKGRNRGGKKENCRRFVSAVFYPTCVLPPSL